MLLQVKRRDLLAAMGSSYSYEELRELCSAVGAKLEVVPGEAEAGEEEVIYVIESESADDRSLEDLVRDIHEFQKAVQKYITVPVQKDKDITLREKLVPVQKGKDNTLPEESVPVEAAKFLAEVTRYAEFKEYTDMCQKELPWQAALQVLQRGKLLDETNACLGSEEASLNADAEIEGFLLNKIGSISKCKESLLETLTRKVFAPAADADADSLLNKGDKILPPILDVVVADQSARRNKEDQPPVLDVVVADQSASGKANRRKNEAFTKEETTTLLEAVEKMVSHREIWKEIKSTTEIFKNNPRRKQMDLKDRWDTMVSAAQRWRSLVIKKNGLTADEARQSVTIRGSNIDTQHFERILSAEESRKKAQQDKKEEARKKKEDKKNAGGGGKAKGGGG